MRLFKAFFLTTLAIVRGADPGMVLVPKGTFQMGRTKLTSDDNTKMRPNVLLDDRPVHQVTLPAFHLDAKEVTHAEYAEFVRATMRLAPYHWVKGEMPAELAKVAVYNVSWEDAKAYCDFRGKRLPSEAEWERAARGGLEGADFPWGPKYEAKLARHNTETGPGEPGKYPPNPFGLFDMAGNLAEWTADWFQRDYYAHSPALNPKGPATGMYKVIRGGAWSDPNKRITVFFRNWVRPVQKQPNIGFRCALDGVSSEQQIQNLISKFNGTVTLYARNLVTGVEYSIRGADRVRTASTIKLPILVAAHEAVANGRAHWNDELTLREEDKVYGSGVVREFTAKQKFLLQDMATLMIVVSDNTATNLLIDKLSADYVNEVMEKYGLRDTRSNRKILGDGTNLKPNVSGESAFGKLEENKKYGIGVSSPKDMVQLLAMLDKGTLVSPAASKAMVEVLKRQQFKDGIGRHLPGYTVASKSGALDALRSDVGLVYGPKGEKYAIAVTVDGMPNIDYSPDNIGNILISDLTPLILDKLQ